MKNRKVNKIIKSETMERYLQSYPNFYLHNKYSTLLRSENIDGYISYLSDIGLILAHKRVHIVATKTYLHTILQDINNAIINFSYKNDLSFLSNDIKDECYYLIQINIKPKTTINQLIKYCKLKVFS